MGSSSLSRDWTRVPSIGSTELKPLDHQGSPFPGFKYYFQRLPGSSDSKDSICNAEDPDLIPGLGRSPGGGHGNPLQYSLLENPMDRGAWCPTVHGVTKSWTQLSNLTLSFQRLPLSETQVVLPLSPRPATWRGRGLSNASALDHSQAILNLMQSPWHQVWSSF